MRDSAIPQSDADYAEFTCGGYLLVRTAHAPDWVSTRPLLPARPLSVSSCIYPRFPESYAVSWCQQTPESAESNAVQSFDSMGIPEQERDSAIDWATRTYGIEHGAWGIFFRISDARKACAEFLAQTSDIRLLGIGLHQSLVSDYLQQTRPAEPEPGYAPVGACGQWTTLSERNSLENGGHLRGFELVVTQYGLLTCSWLCNGLEKTGAGLNSYGLIANHEIALKLATEAGASGAEPGLWLPWAIVEYAL